MPIVRTSIAAGPQLWFRLVVPLPTSVVFPSVRYVLQLQSVLAASRHELMAHDASRGHWWPIGPAYRGEEFLRRAVFELGVPVYSASVGAVVFEWLTRENRAQRVPPPTDDLTRHWPADRRALGAWVKSAALLRPAADDPTLG